MAIEYEVKLAGERAALLAALDRIGAAPRGERLLEDDLVLDRAGDELANSGRLLRLRRRGEEFLLTFKGPYEQGLGVKARPEVQTPVADGEAMRSLLEELGYRVALRYQKYRTLYRCPLSGCEGVALSLDETPIGDFLEVEGDPEQIHRCVAALGFSRQAYETRSYLEIYRSRGGTGDMLFDGAADGLRR